jgi:hypothetical protein
MLLSYPPLSLSLANVRIGGVTDPNRIMPVVLINLGGGFHEVKVAGARAGAGMHGAARAQ